MDTSGYDEFSYLAQNQAEWGLTGPLPRVRRCHVAVEGLRHVSGLQWGEGDPALVLLHGHAQNAHTFDTLALALDVPLLALDLPHHGHSDAHPAGHHAVADFATDVSEALRALVHRPVILVGMSLGGLVALLVADELPDLITHVVLIDITPGALERRDDHVRSFVEGPPSFASLDEMLERTRSFAPHRSPASLLRGIRHNAVQRSDGRWVWRHQQHGAPTRAATSIPRPLVRPGRSSPAPHAGAGTARRLGGDRRRRRRTSPTSPRRRYVGRRRRGTRGAERRTNSVGVTLNKHNLTACIARRTTGLIEKFASFT